MLLEAFAKLRVQQPNTILLIAGDGPMTPELRTQIENRDLSAQVTLTGQLCDSEISEVLRLSDIFVLPSESEGIPASLVEAMAVGLPPVVTDIPGTEMIIGEIHGLRVATGDSAALTASLNRLMTDHDLRKKLGNTARELFLSSYTPDKVGQAYERLYRELLHPSP